MQQINQSEQAKLDARYRAMLILWLAFLSSIAVYFVIPFFVPRPNVGDGQQKILTLVFPVLGICMVIASVVVKRKFLLLSVEKQQVNLVQKGLIVAAALCETAALLGLLDWLLTGNRSGVLLIIAVIGMVLHFPRRQHLLEAGLRGPNLRAGDH